MTVHVRYFCNKCNASAQERQPGDMRASGYLEVPIPAHPVGQPIPLPDGWKVVHHGKLHCAECAAAEDIVREIRPVRSTGGWPARSSPFGS